MMDDFELEDIDFEDEPEFEEPGNKTFKKVAGFLGGILILSVIAVAVYALVIQPRNQIAQSTQEAAVYAQHTEIAMMAAMTVESESLTAPASGSDQESSNADAGAAPTDTPKSEKAISTEDPRTATVAALLAEQTQNPTYTQELDQSLTPASELPDTGFGDNVGITELVAIAGVLVLVIFFARRFRSAR